MTSVRTDREDEPATEQDGWARWGWLLGGAWVIFLIGPLLAAWTLDRLASRLTAVVLVLVFAAIYIGVFRHTFSTRGPRATSLVEVYFWLALVLISVTQIPFIGFEAISFIPFLVAMGSFILPWAFAVGFLATAVGFTLLLLLTTDGLDSKWYFPITVSLVGIMTLVMRWFWATASDHRQTKHDLVMLAERERVARDVHDVLGHSLTVLTVKSELAQRLMEVDPAAARTELEHIQSITRESLAEIRATVAGLRVVRLGDELESARVALRSAGIAADIPEGPDLVDPRHRMLLAWSLREATTNVVRHSRARSCRVELGENSMRVIDDGRGLNGSNEGNGLRGLRERVDEMGGRVSIGENLPTGTVLEVRL